MSKEDACKVTSANKHKERKPKKPHYIPRPWGKPYNYKCFQCPFTCMEKSHLYNHMKYSLCKNSLSLLIESDWPYKKGNILHPEQLRPYQQAHSHVQLASKDGLEQPMATEERQRQLRASEEEEEEAEERENQMMDNDEEGKDGGESGGGGGGGAEVSGSTKETSGSKSGETAESGKKRSRPPESERLMADMLSLEDQLLRARSVEVEAQLKHYKLSKSCPTAPGLLAEQWRLFASSHAKAKVEGTQPRVGTSIPCYPPPSNLVEYPDPAGLSLSMLGVGYPISPGLFSYVNSAIPTAAAAAAAAQTHAQLAQLPLLASATQLMPPASSAHPDRTLLPPRLYYPFMCEHTFGQGEAGKSAKSSPNGLDTELLSGFHPKVNLWKVPALRPGAVAATAVPPAGWLSPQRESLDQGYRLGDKQQAVAKDSKAPWGLKRTAAPLGNHEAPAEKKPAVGLQLELLKNIQTASGLNVSADKLLVNSSLQGTPLQTHPDEVWYRDSLTSPNSEASSHPTCGGPASQERKPRPHAGEGASESVAALLSDLSKALQEYQEAERNISHMEKEELPAQCRLWEHLGKIRSELSHIHQALERTSRHSDGPLDLSVKKGPSDVATGEASGPKVINTETEEEEEVEEEEEEEEYEDEDSQDKTGKEEEEEERLMKASLESRKHSLDLLIKMSQAAVVGAEVLAPGALGLRPPPAEALWPNRTTKCEADSSVLVCPDGRSVVFTDIPPPPARTPKRPPSIQRLEAQCPPSPLTAADS